MKHHKLTNAYESYNFLYSHPKFMLPERHEVTPEEAVKLEAQGFWITRDAGGKTYRMYRHLHRHALTENLDIHYAMVDKPENGKVNDDASKNKFVEVWLEFGPLEYAYASGGSKPMADWDTETARLNYHDTDLDTGGPTFDAALIRLAKLVRKKYGDYEEKIGIDRRNSQCGKPECADCKDIGRTMKRIGLDMKKEDNVSID